MTGDASAVTGNSPEVAQRVEATVNDASVKAGTEQIDEQLRDRVVFGDNIEVLQSFPSAVTRLIYIDPPFNTRKTRIKRTLETVHNENGDRTGFGGRSYQSTEVGRTEYNDSFDNYLDFIEPRLRQARRLLTEDGTLYLHLDYREAHYCKILLDNIFGRDCFINEIIWAYDYGGRSNNRWPAKHDTILMYTKNTEGYFFDQEAIERIPYMAPGLVSAEKASRGKLPTDVWWHTIVATNGSEKTGYATQKPEGVLRRIITASSQPGDLVMDFFAGSGTTGAVARQLGRSFLLVDNNWPAIETIARRLGSVSINYTDIDGNSLDTQLLRPDQDTLF